MTFPSLRVLVAILFASSLATASAADKAWARLNGCKLIENDSNDGDSFRVDYKGKEYIFRLYFVDTCETSYQIPSRVKEQAKFLGITRERVIEAGHAAGKFARSLLSPGTFTVVTKWEDARGASRLPRHYAFVLFGSNDENDLASTLAQNGFVRIYGMPAEPPGPVTAAQFRASLLKLDAQARAQKLGIFGNLAGGAATAGSGVAGGSSTGSTGSRASAGRPVSAAPPILLPKSYRSPEITDDPADAAIDDFAVQAAEAVTALPATEFTISEGDFSEIPGWKPKGKSAP